MEKLKKSFGSLFVKLLIMAFALSFFSVAFAKMKIIVVSHGTAADPFWSVAKNGVAQAEKDFRRSAGLRVFYRAPATFDMVEMSRLIDQAVAEKPDGLVVTIPDANALGPAIRNAVKAGIPVISMNSGSDDYEKLGVLIHVGQTEYEAGLGAGKRMKALGGKKAIVINHEVGNVALDLRADGFKKGMGGRVEVVGVSKDPNEIKAAVSARLRKDGNIDSVLALGPDAAHPTYDAIKELGKLGSIKLASFDLSPQLLQAATKKEVVFLIDQQQYLQGYLPIAILVQHVKFNTMPSGVVQTGPGFVTPDNAAKVIALAKKGYR